VIFPDQAVRIVIATKPVDFRKGHDGLASMAQAESGFAPKSGVMVVFRSKRGDRVKVLFWDGSGIVMIYKRLEQGGFTLATGWRWGDAAIAGCSLRRCLQVSIGGASMRHDRPLQLRQNESNRLVNMGFCGGLGYEEACPLLPHNPLIWMLSRPLCGRRFWSCGPKWRVCAPKPNGRIISLSWFEGKPLPGRGSPNCAMPSMGRSLNS